MKKLLLLIIIIICLTGCKKNDNELDNIINTDEYIIIDVRTNEEYESLHVSGSINIPYNELSESIDKTKKVLVYCQSGKRSQIAYQILKNLGYDVYDLGAINGINLPKE